MLQKDKNKRNNKNSSTLKKVLLFITIFILLLLGGGIVYAFHLYDKTEDMVTESHESVGREEEKSQLRKVKVDPVEDNVSILFIGVDTGQERAYEEKSRSDALLLATFNKHDQSVKLLSIPRDSYVYVPEVGYSTKINHAHFFGGPKASIETVEELLNVPVDYYVRLNFEAFIEVVDSLDGIMFDVPYEINEMDSSDTKNAIHLNPGYQKINGEEALALARTRKYDNDIERGRRQQELIKAIVSKSTSASSVFKISNVLDAIGENMTTNLTFDEIKTFFTFALEKDVSIQTVNLEGTGDFSNNGAWYFTIDEASKDEIQVDLREHLDLPPYPNSSSHWFKEETH